MVDFLGWMLVAFAGVFGVALCFGVFIVCAVWWELRKR
jgi:hypothetical protein